MVAKRQPSVKSESARSASIGGRIREERERLGLSQAAFIGGDKSSQIRYEKGERSPDAEYLSRVADSGADVQYIVTGKRGGQSDSSSGLHLATSTTPIDAELLRQVIAGVEDVVANQKLKPDAEKKAQAILLLYEHFQAIGRVERGFIERQLRLVA